MHQPTTQLPLEKIIRTFAITVPSNHGTITTVRAVEYFRDGELVQVELTDVSSPSSQLSGSIHPLVLDKLEGHYHGPNRQSASLPYIQIASRREESEIITL